MTKTPLAYSLEGTPELLAAPSPCGLAPHEIDRMFAASSPSDVTNQGCAYCHVNPRNVGDRCCGARECKEKANGT